MLKTRYVVIVGATKALLESGCSLIVASVNERLEPHASRAWGVDVLDETSMRLLVDADDAQLHANLARTGSIAVTVTNIRTLRSIQLKGRTTQPEPGTEVDAARMRRFCDEFFADVEATDGVLPALLERMVPARVMSYLVDVQAMFDQTPGPQAGAAVAQ